jgi:hypothetical protein
MCKNEAEPVLLFERIPAYQAYDSDVVFLFTAHIGMVDIQASVVTPFFGMICFSN